MIGLRTVTVVRCKNWLDEPEICGEYCGVAIAHDDELGSDWWDALLTERPEWLVVIRACPEHDRHIDPYCSLICFTRLHSRHEHHH